MNDAPETLFITADAEGGAAAGAAATDVLVGPRPPSGSSCASTPGRGEHSGAMDAAVPGSIPADGAARSTSVAPSKAPRPSSSGSSSFQQRQPRGSDTGSKIQWRPSIGDATPPAIRNTNGRGHADATAAAISAAAAGGDGEGRWSSQDLVKAGSGSETSVSGEGAAVDAPRVPRAPSEQEAVGPAAQQLPAAVTVAAPWSTSPLEGPTAAWAGVGTGTGAGSGTAAASSSPAATTRRGFMAAAQRRPSAAGSDTARADASQPLKPPLPPQSIAAAAAPAAAVPAPEVTATVALGSSQAGDGDARRVVKRSSSGISISGLAADARAAGGDGFAVAAVRAGTAGSSAAWPQERLSRMSSSGNVAPAAADGGCGAATAKMLYRKPRESSSSGARETLPPGSPLLPFRASNNGQHPASPSHSKQNKLQQQQQQDQEQLLQSPPLHQSQSANRGVRFSSRESASSDFVGSNPICPMGQVMPPSAASPSPLSKPPSSRRVSDSSSCVSYCPAGGGREHGSLAAPPPPPPPGLLVLRRPSDDATSAARRDRSNSQPASVNIMWASPAPGAAAARPGSGAAGVGGRPAQAAGGGRRGSGSGLHATRAAAAAAGASAGGGGGILRAVDLAPLSLPGGPDTALREALAREAVANVARLSSAGPGAELPESDFGYSRVVELYRRHQQQYQQQQQIQASSQQAQQQQHPAAGEPATPSRPARRASINVPAGEPDSDTATAAASSPPCSPWEATIGSPEATPPRPSKPPLAAKSRRSVLKPTALGGGGNANSTPPSETGAPLAAAATHGPSGPVATLATTSYRFLGLRRPSSKAGIAGSDSQSAAEGGGGGGRSSWIATFGGGGGATAAAAAAANPDPMGFRTAENVDIRIHCMTFNMGGAVPAAAALPESLFSGSYLSPDIAADAAHLYVFSTQESGPLAEWEAAVGVHLGRRYTRVAAESLMSIHILLFAVRSMAPYITDVQTSSVATGVGNVLGNKGGVAVTFSLLGARVLLVGAHFAAHDQNVERRNADFHRICAGLFAPPSTDGGGGAGAAATVSGGGGGRASVNTAAIASEISASAAARLPTCSAATGTVGGAAPPLAAPAPLQRRVTLGPTLSRFSRGNGVALGVVQANDGNDGGAAAAAAGGGGGGDDDDDGGDGDGGAVQFGRRLTRALSSSSVSSLASTASAYPQAPEGALRARAPSFWGSLGLGSFASAQRQSTALLAHFDVVLWMGDLNYRIAGTPEVVKYAIDKNMVEVLRANDQLQKQQRKGKVLQGFQEMPIAFAPTFKFARGTDAYDLRRSPSWTDRVLYLVNADPLFADLRPLYYMSVPELRTSDHKPVIAGFELSLSPQHAGDNRHARQRGCSIS